MVDDESNGATTMLRVNCMMNSLFYSPSTLSSFPFVFSSLRIAGRAAYQ